jgi:hypothetical protein
MSRRFLFCQEFLMIAYRCIPMPTEIAERFRQTGQDDGGNSLRLVRADSGSPCRHCLQDAAAGDGLLLGSYHFGNPQGIYWAPSPVWVHAEPCPRFEQSDTVPEIVRNRLVSVRAYDSQDQMIYELGEVCRGTKVEAPLERALGDSRTGYVNIHTAGPGCFLCRAERC